MAGRTVCSDHEVGEQRTTPVELEARESGVRFDGTAGPAFDRHGAGMDCSGAQHVVEHSAGHDPAASGVTDPVETGENPSPVVRADGDETPDVDAGWLGRIQVCKDLEAPRTDEVAACLVSREPRLVD